MENFKTVDSLIAEIQGSGQFFKDNPQLIDKPSIYRWVSLGLKSFGLNIMQKKSKVVDIENYKGILENDFGKLSLAVFCECSKAVVPKDKCDRLLETYFYKSRLETKYIIESSVGDDGCKEEKCPTEETEIVEKFFLKEADCDVSLHYKNPRYVTLGRDVLHGGCTDDCINRGIISSPYEINIKGQTIYASFKNGSLYLEYFSLPEIDGIPVIPSKDGDRGYLELYLEYLIKRKVLEDAMMSKDATDLFTMFKYMVDKEKEYYRLAHQDLSPLNLVAFWKLIDENRKRISKFNIYLK